MKKFILSLGVIVLFFACSKDDTPTPISSNSNNNYDTGVTAKKSSDLRKLIWMGTGQPGQVEPDCLGKGGNCLPDLIVTGIVGYTDLVGAIENNTQQEFFNNNNYASLFGIEENHQIQDALEKGHLKIKLVKFGNKDFNLFIKPQHEKFEGNKLANKVVLAIPVLK